MTEIENKRLGWLLATLLAATTLLSAFLLFQVQPVISKSILPWFGGSPAVWTTCMLFFQLFLFLGYCYAHLLSRQKFRLQVLIHLSLLAVGACLLPIGPSSDWKPKGADDPTLRIMLLLVTHVGLPYFLLSATGPLLQTWFSSVFKKSPYRLYALSNIGSLSALLSYPFLVEPALSTTDQSIGWSWGFGAFVLICGLTSCFIFRFASARDNSSASPAESTRSAAEPPSWSIRVLWIALPAFASITLLATTNHVCQDVAVIPFLWVLPLSLYLLTFILCFDADGWYRRGLTSTAAMATIGVISIIASFGIYPSLTLEITIAFAAMFALCMLCHGELVRRKPAPAFLTSFYLMIAAGGALGGMLVAIVCPVVFDIFFEMNLVLLAGFLIAAMIFVVDNVQRFHTRGWWRVVASALILVGAVATSRAQLGVLGGEQVTVKRNFYGVTKVIHQQGESPDESGLALVHGRIVHGFQYDDPARKKLPTKYFVPESGVGVTLNRYPAQGPMRVGVIGLGVGTLAAYGREGDSYRFYEINPAVVEIANRHFTFLRDSPAKIDIVLGDARLTMEQEESQQFDVFIIDAFSGDAIPTHLLTVEAFKIYMRHLKPNGVLAANISNRHIDLRGVFQQLASTFDLQSIFIELEVDEDIATSGSQWVVASRNDQFMADDVVQSAAIGFHGRYAKAPLWTDERSNLLQILK